MLSLRATGLATSLGGWTQGCAALRAGVSLPQPAPDAETMAPGDEEPGPVEVHAAGAATYGFAGAGRLAALLLEALRDLGARFELAHLRADSGLFLALPDPAARGFALARSADEEDPDEAADRIAALGERLATSLQPHLPFPWKAELHGGEECAFASALQAAEEAIRARAIRRALVCAADSWASASALRMAAEEGLLKSDENPTGFVPGEAGAALVLEGPGADAPALVGAVARDEDGRGPGGEVPADGRALGRCLAASLRAHPARGSVGLLSDHDGRTWRAADLGSALVVASRAWPELAGAPVSHPALGWGRTGVAAAGVAAGAALHALERGPVRTDTFLVLSSADGGGRAAFQVRRGERRKREGS